METYLIALANELGITISKEQSEKLFLYQTLLLEWNQKMNLTAITDEREIILKHFIDSMTILKQIPQNASVIDVGTGAGFPGIVIKIMREDVSITLLDSLNKRVQFLNDVIQKNSLTNIQAIHGRAEDFGKDKKYREKYEVATARAVANLRTLSEFCLPFIKVGGTFIAMKGSNIEEFKEAEHAIQLLGGKVENTVNFFLPQSSIERNLILIKKENHTPSEYPRRAGMPENKPL